ncbi:MAG: non-canonical purine NTP pyrophosphatase [Planctomycetes bacterium]|nr:non-canonical purine NTP pyrophosphatase [Planctomycetota bacterium]
MAHPHEESEVLLVLGTANRHKLAEVSRALGGVTTRRGAPVRVAGAAALPPGPEIDERGETFLENARIKARAYARRAAGLPPEVRPRWVLADDSGLAVDALGGAPGVRSARYAGSSATDGDNNRKLLAALASIPPGRRGAAFVCALSLVEVAPAPSAAPREVLSVEGRCRGEIIGEGRGSGGFGYDPLFLFPDLGKTLAELSGQEKDEVSHRGRALRALRERLEALE